jgi:hypothetical protein
MARGGIAPPKALGVPVADVRALGKRLGRDHAPAGALPGRHEARVLASFVGDPGRLRRVASRRRPSAPPDLSVTTRCAT